MNQDGMIPFRPSFFMNEGLLACRPRTKLNKLPVLVSTRKRSGFFEDQERSRTFG
jgi:hypothetical protein